MKPLLLTLLLATLCATGYGQTLKSVMYNTTNDTVVSTNRIIFPLLGVAGGSATVPSLTYASGTNLFGTFASSALGIGPFLGFSVDGTRRFFISTNTIRAELPLSFNNATNEAASRTNLGLGATWLTNDNVTNFRTAIGLGANNAPSFESVNVSQDFRITDGTNDFAVIAFDEAAFYTGVKIGSSLGLGFFGTNAATAAATTRTNLGAARAPIWAYKATNQTNSTTNLVSDTALTFTAAANTKYAVTLLINVLEGSGNIPVDGVITKATNAQVFGFWTAYEPINSGTRAIGAAITERYAFFIPEDNDQATTWQRFVVVGATNTNSAVTFEFANSITNAGSVVIGAGSYLKAEIIE